MHRDLDIKHVTLFSNMLTVSHAIYMLSTKILFTLQYNRRIHRRGAQFNRKKWPPLEKNANQSVLKYILV